MGMFKIGGDAVIEKVDQRKYGALYRRCIERDFARNERRPLFLIHRLHGRGLYDFLALRDDATGRLLAYAGLLHAPNVDSMLLDYLAVEPEYRDKGVGSRFMRELATYCTAGGILIECETPAMARGTAERAVRERRVGFYLIMEPWTLVRSGTFSVLATICCGCPSKSSLQKWMWGGTYPRCTARAHRGGWRAWPYM